jgi:hypothetical protein
MHWETKHPPKQLLIPVAPVKKNNTKGNFYPFIKIIAQLCFQILLANKKSTYKNQEEQMYLLDVVELQ